MNMPWEAIISFILYVVGSTVGFVWWMATITEQLKTLGNAVTKMTEDNNTYARKEDIAREFALYERQQETMWAKLDKLKEKVDSNGIK